ncbi:hypothetical protein PAAG_11172 [Paracoccidioides lutzii Pb01]|uniref:Uncharacterized protein n=1 Tax=Paracoccidioides lutzii (strain ATCC MYA-826 / Pb01) TaxID=502779 RepID=A0A0A2VMB5_PARBA|nr:hypothetical protein PAAG_11172 [Paracoccidioides lutzii Pb01]KGQ01999.1 hypothetical protein PAAG_11172 [Paracoccidioides lutzii Pb01]
MDVDEQIVVKARFIGRNIGGRPNVLLANDGDENGTFIATSTPLCNIGHGGLHMSTTKLGAGLKVGYCLQRKRTYQESSNRF